ncbi:putative RNA-directed DNA polymerase [Helianthus annuus]|nr:putative RNA-directed DNA polymerase [Helianthus annuus]
MGLREYRPINLIGVISKTISKILANRLKMVIGTIISENQTAFLKGRYILDSPLMLNEIMAWIKKYNKKVFLLKIDFEKAYDNVCWSFLLDIMGQMGFPDLWCKWIKGILASARSSVLVNGSPTFEFNCSKGVRQGDPLSPFLFLLVMEALSNMLSKARMEGFFKERLETRRGNGVFNWRWARNPESEEERKEWKECCEALNMVSLSTGKDAWFWSGDSQIGFSVKALKSALIKDRGTHHPPNYVWCKWVPIKCNIMNWRGNLDRLPTRLNLRRRNVVISSSMCPFCEEAEESVEHLFTACSVALRVWTAFSDWCKIPPLYLFEFKDILEIHKFIKRIKKEEKIMYGLALTTAWCIWKERNEVVFKQKRCSPQDIIREFKSRSFAWFKNRSSCNYIRWTEWCKYPMYML